MKSLQLKQARNYRLLKA